MINIVSYCLHFIALYVQITSIDHEFYCSFYANELNSKHTLLEIVSTIKKATIQSEIKHVKIAL